MRPNEPDQIPVTMALGAYSAYRFIVSYSFPKVVALPADKAVTEYQGGWYEHQFLEAYAARYAGEE